MSAPLVLTCRCGRTYGPQDYAEYKIRSPVGTLESWTPEEKCCPHCWDATALRRGKADQRERAERREGLLVLGPDGSEMTMGEADRLSAFHPTQLKPARRSMF